jgi:hypothetical protein
VRECPRRKRKERRERKARVNGSSDPEKIQMPEPVVMRRDEGGLTS